jgi:hypothetical protein
VFKSEEKVIADMRFVTTKLPAMRSFKLLTRLVKAVGPAIGALMKLDPDLQLESAGAELGGAFASIDANEAEALIPEIFSTTSVFISDATGGREMPLNKRENIDMVFSGPGLKVMFQALGFVLGVNYRDFGVGSAPAAPQPPNPSAG